MSRKQERAGVTGKRQVLVKNYDFPNILKVKYAGIEYTLIPDTKQVTPVATTIAKKQVMRRNLEKAATVGEQLRRMVAQDINERARGKGQ